MSRIIMFTMGSVQEYIMESRKVIDLKNSSKILSKLMKMVKDVLENQYSGEILLPYIDKVEQSNTYNVNIPNYIIAKYENKDSIGQELEGLIKKQFKKEIEESKNHRLSEIYDKMGYEIKQQLLNHVNSILDIYWVEAEIDEVDLKDDSKYKKIYKALYKNLEAVKHTKNFKEYKPEQGRKCSVCGKRNAIVYRKNTKCEKLFDLQEDTLNIEQEIFKIGEGLCGACFVKRTIDDSNIQSTADIALAHWKENNKMKRSQQYEVLEEIVSEYKSSSKYGDCELLYEDVLINEINKSILKGKEIKKFEEDKEKVQALFKEFYGKQEKFYCIYRMDIDDLGKWMNGKYKKENITLKKYQHQLSSNINDFLKEVRKYFLDSKNSLLIYAGGDDLLVLTPLKEGLGTIKEVNRCFHRNVKKDNLFSNITFSHGLFICHYRDSLSESIRLSKERLENIKEKYKNISSNNEKNGLIISILTEGYSYKEFYTKNYLKNQFVGELIFDSLFDYFSNDSSYFHNELSNTFLSMDGEFTYSSQEQHLFNMILVEQKRLMKRSNNEKKFNEEIYKILSYFLINNNYEYDSIGLENYFNLFYMIRKILSILGDEKENEDIKNKTK